jgi:uncharacterized protein
MANYYKMTLSNQKAPLIKQGWLRVVIFFVCYIACVSLITSMVILFTLPLVTTNITNDKTQLMKQAPLFYIATTLAAVISFLMVFLFRRLCDRRSIVSLGFSFSKNGGNAMLGLFTALLILCTGTLFLYFNKNLSWNDVDIQPQHLFTGAMGMLIVAFSEELVFRGYILNNLLESMNKWVALVISATLFCIMHATNPNINAISLINIFLAGLLIGINYIYTKNLWYGIFFHFSWNFFQGSLLGYEVSGATVQSIFSHQMQGDELFTGGIFGFEGSIVATVLTGGCLLLYSFIYLKKYKAVAVE